MSELDLAAKIAREIFAAGDEPGRPVQRMRYMAGEYPDNEIDQGGVCESALALIIRAAIKDHGNRRTPGA